jgi:hypothetical protein
VLSSDAHVLEVFQEQNFQPFDLAIRCFSGRLHWVDFDRLWEATQRDIPIDCAKLAASSAQFIVSATSFATGEPVFLEPGEADIMESLDRPVSRVPGVPHRFRGCES